LTHSFHNLKKKNPLYELQWISFLSPSGKNLPKEEKKKAGYITCTQLNMVVNERISFKFKSLN
jgi:hypothetical protein